jgi:hypothetical protein
MLRETIAAQLVSAFAADRDAVGSKAFPANSVHRAHPHRENKNSNSKTPAATTQAMPAQNTTNANGQSR